MDEENGDVARPRRFLRERTHPDRPLAVRIAGIVGGLIILAVGASFGGASMAYVPPPFPGPFESETTSEQVLAAAQPNNERSIDVQMDMRDSVLSGQATITSTTSDRLTELEVLGALEQFPSLMHNVVGDLWVDGVEVVWQMPTRERPPDSTAVEVHFDSAWVSFRPLIQDG
ncbi:hypothetical protein [Agromyces bauzanensis]